MTWTLHLDDEVIPARTGNARDGRWGRHRHAKQVRHAVGWAAAAADHPPPYDRVKITVTRRVTDDRRRDPDNLAAAAKPALDGLVDAGIIPDDSSAVVRSITYQIMRYGPYKPGWTIELEDA